MQKEFFDALVAQGYNVDRPDAYFDLYGGERPGRYPDVRVCLDGRDVVFKIQIRPIQVPDIQERTSYYDVPTAKMYWVLYEVSIEKLRSFQWDVIAAQGGICYSADSETRQMTVSIGHLFLRVYYPVFKISQYGELILNWHTSVESFDQFYQDESVLNKQAHITKCVENCNKFNLFSFESSKTVAYTPKTLANEEQQQRFVEFWQKLIPMYKNNYKEYTVQWARGLRRIAILLDEDIQLVEKLANDEIFFKVMCTFISFRTGRIEFYGFENFKGLMNNFISNKTFHQWLPIMMPTILSLDKVPNGFEKHLDAAKNYKNENQIYTSLTSKIITYFMPSLLTTKQ